MKEFNGAIVLCALVAMTARSVGADTSTDAEAGGALPELAFAVMAGQSEVEIQRSVERTVTVEDAITKPRLQGDKATTPPFQIVQLVETQFLRIPLEAITATQIDGRAVPVSVLRANLSNKTAVIFLSDVRAKLDRSCLGIFKPDTLVLQIKPRVGATLIPIPERNKQGPRRANAPDRAKNGTGLGQKTQGKPNATRQQRHEGSAE